MNTNKLKLWISLSLMGLLSVATMLFSDLLTVFNLKASLPPNVSEEIAPLLTLINPSITVLIATTLGCLVYDKVGFRVPILEQILNIKEKPEYSYKSLLGWGVIGGIAGGLLIVLINYVFLPYLPTAYLNTSESQGLHIVSRLFYGGVVEEIMMRFGLMSIFVWLLFKITKTLNVSIFWVANILTALMFALGHFPALLTLVPDPSIWLYAYILLANGVAGLIYGYLYMKRGLESAMIAHMLTHVVMYIIL